MATSFGRGAQNINSLYFKPILRKAYHRKSSSPDMVGDTMKLNGEEAHNKKSFAFGNLHQEQQQDGDSQMWVPDSRTGIYYPKGQEKVMEDVSPRAGKDYTINWFSNP